MRVLKDENEIDRIPCMLIKDENLSQNDLTIYFHSSSEDMGECESMLMDL